MDSLQQLAMMGSLDASDSTVVVEAIGNDEVGTVRNHKNCWLGSLL